MATAEAALKQLWAWMMMLANHDAPEQERKREGTKMLRHIVDSYCTLDQFSTEEL